MGKNRVRAEEKRTGREGEDDNELRNCETFSLSLPRFRKSFVVVLLLKNHQFVKCTKVYLSLRWVCCFLFALTFYPSFVRQSRHWRRAPTPLCSGYDMYLSISMQNVLAFCNSQSYSLSNAPFAEKKFVLTFFLPSTHAVCCVQIKIVQWKKNHWEWE